MREREDTAGLTLQQACFVGTPLLSLPACSLPTTSFTIVTRKKQGDKKKREEKKLNLTLVIGSKALMNRLTEHQISGFGKGGDNIFCDNGPRQIPLKTSMCS